MKVLAILSAFILIILPPFAFADGLVPCGDPGQSACQTCHFFTLVQNIFRWVFGLASTLVTIIIVLGGLRLVTSAGNAVAKSEARKIISAAIIGFILIGCSWFIIEFALKALAGYSDEGIWSSLQCVAQPNPPEATVAP